MKLINLYNRKENHFENTWIGLRIIWPSVPSMVSTMHICAKLFMKDLTSKLEPCQSPCVRMTYFLRAPPLLENF